MREPVDGKCPYCGGSGGSSTQRLSLEIHFTFDGTWQRGPQEQPMVPKSVECGDCGKRVRFKLGDGSQGSE